MGNNGTLVSVIVISYNSERTILDTLDSIKRQSYNDIELIVSDDGSKDNTIQICKQWIGENASRFVKATIITTPQNTGTAGNCNRGCKKANGEWLKIIAADDLLLPDCISDDIEYCSNHVEISVLFSEMESFVENEKGIYTKEITNFGSKDFWNKNAHGQFVELLYCNFLPAPTAIIKKELVNENPYDEKFPLMEDYPLWIKLTKSGVKLYFMNRVTVMYRQSDSISNTRKRLFSPSYRDTYCKFYWNILNPLIKEEKYLEAYNYQRKILFMYDVESFIFHNKKNTIVLFIIKLIAGLLKRFKTINFEK